MALLTVLFLIAFYGTCLFGIHWLLKRFASSQPWHKWLRRGVWTAVLVLFFIDTIYYQIFVVHGMCAADKTRVYPAPPVSSVVAGPFIEEEFSKKVNQPWHLSWPCKNESVIGQCFISGGDSEKKESLLYFNARKVSWEFTQDSMIYGVETYYEQGVHWLTKKLLGISVGGFRPKNKACEEPFKSTFQPIDLIK